MTLDLDDLTADWSCTGDQPAARIVVGRDGVEMVQLRVDQGVLQMFPDGRPDGDRYRGMPSVLEYIRHEQRLKRSVRSVDWIELQRECGQLFLRRLAFAGLADEELRREDFQGARGHLRRCIRDIDICLHGGRLLEEADDAPSLDCGARLTLVFNRARVQAQLHVIDERFEEALEEALAGAATLEAALEDAGLDAEQRECDSGVAYLRELAQQLRRRYSISQTLRERLEAAVEQEDFELATKLREQLIQRETERRQTNSPDCAG